MPELNVTASPDPDDETVLFVNPGEGLELQLDKEDANKNVAFFVSGIHGTPMWQVLDLQKLVPGCRVQVIIELDGMQLSHQTFTAPVQFAVDPESALARVAGGSVEEDGDAGATPPAPASPPPVAQPPKDGENDAMAGGAG